MIFVAASKEKERKLSCVPAASRLRFGSPHTSRGGPEYVLVAIMVEAGGFLTSYETFAVGFVATIQSL